MKLPLINGFITSQGLQFSRGNASNITAVFPDLKLCQLIGENTTAYLQYNKNNKFKENDNVYLPSLIMPEKELDSIIETVYLKRLNLMVKTCETLEEVGIFDSKYKLSPIMLLHKLGILENTTIVGGVYLDKDDTALMAQENVKLVLTPTMCAGYGYGLAPIISYVNAGLNITFGTGDGVFNKKADILEEARFLFLASCASLNKKDVVSFDILSSLTCGNEEYAKELQKILF